MPTVTEPESRGLTRPQWDCLRKYMGRNRRDLEALHSLRLVRDQVASHTQLRSIGFEEIREMARILKMQLPRS